jgi:poly[(R)-3-hydroxyalkanoate] polymerase subunit PhaC
MGSLAAELRRIGVGTSVVAPSQRDRRFADPAWTENPLLRGIVQAYLAAGRTGAELVEDAALDWRDDKRIRFLADNLAEALSPSNVPLVNPASAKAAIDSGGLNLARGGMSLLRDLATPPRVPEMVDTSQFEVGRNIAVTPGAVVLRTEVLELIQYRPQTDQVREVPLLVVPPTIN